MGLYAEANLLGMGFPAEVSATARVGNEEFTETVAVDYAAALDVFVSTFLEISNSLVPVRTGYLKSTLSSRVTGEFTAEARADCEYAQFVEYGTWKQWAQPYFRPAINEATNAMLIEAQKAKTRAEELAQEMVGAVAQAWVDALWNFGEAMTGSFLMGGLNAFLGLWFFFPLALLAYGIIDTLTAPLVNEDKDYDNDPFLGGLASFVNVMIT